MIGVVMLSFSMRPMAEEAQLQGLIRNARENLEDGNFAAAMRGLSVAVKAAPNRSDIRQALAEAYLFNNQPRQAMQELKKAVEISPMDYEINDAYGEALEDLESPQAALAFYGEMIAKFPGKIEPRAHAAAIHEEVGQPRLAEKLWEEATRGEDNDDTPWVRWGQLLAATGDNQGALKIFRKGIEALPNSALLHFNKGALLSIMGKDKETEAVDELRRAANLDPEFGQLLDQIGVAKATKIDTPISVVALRENADGAYYVRSLLDKVVIGRLVVDDNVTNTLVSTPLAKRLGVDIIKVRPVNYCAAAKEGTPTFKLKTVEVGSVDCNAVDAAIYNPAADERNAPKDGVLGHSFLGRFKFILDTRHGQLIVIGNPQSI
jgi:tetratricopeptide (TPR) repeat protein